MTYLPDVNVWLALAADAHVHHAAALRWLSGVELGDAVAFCRVTQHGFLRLLTNRAVMGKDSLSAAEAWKKYDLVCTAVDAEFAREPADIEKLWRSRTQHRQLGQNYWTDAYLSSFGASAGCTLVTFDRAFLTHPTVRVVLLPLSR